MRAIRVQSWDPAGADRVHWLSDGGWTACGERPAEMRIVEMLELERLPTVGACFACEMIPVSSPRLREQGPPVLSRPQPGRLRKTGPLYHGLQQRQHGDRLW